jgi:hypothetical protein
MRVISLAVVLAGIVGCRTSNVSTVGPFVRQIYVQPQTQLMTVDSCQVQVETTRNYAYWWLGQNHSTEREVQQGQCWRQDIPTGGAP